MKFKQKYIEILKCRVDSPEAVMLLNLIQKIDGDDGMIRYLYAIYFTASKTSKK